jgi:two-component system sensor histidine kinase MprB
VFDRFYRGASARAAPPARHGSGLGLAIVRQVASGHHGNRDRGDADGGGAPTLLLSVPALISDS